MGGIRLDLAPQAIDVDLEQVALAFILFPPNMPEEQVLRDDTTDILRKVGQHPVFDRRQIDVFPSHHDTTLTIVNHQLADGRDRLRSTPSVVLGGAL